MWIQCSNLQGIRGPISPRSVASSTSPFLSGRHHYLWLEQHHNSWTQWCRGRREESWTPCALDWDSHVIAISQLQTCHPYLAWPGCSNPPSPQLRSTWQHPTSSLLPNSGLPDDIRHPPFSPTQVYLTTSPVTNIGSPLMTGTRCPLEKYADSSLFLKQISLAAGILHQRKTDL